MHKAVSVSVTQHTAPSVLASKSIAKWLQYLRYPFTRLASVLAHTLLTRASARFSVESPSPEPANRSASVRALDVSHQGPTDRVECQVIHPELVAFAPEIVAVAPDAEVERVLCFPRLDHGLARLATRELVEPDEPQQERHGPSPTATVRVIVFMVPASTAGSFAVGFLGAREGSLGRRAVGFRPTWRMRRLGARLRGHGRPSTSHVAVPAQVAHLQRRHLARDLVQLGAEEEKGPDELEGRPDSDGERKGVEERDGAEGQGKGAGRRRLVERCRVREEEGVDGQVCVAGQQPVWKQTRQDVQVQVRESNDTIPLMSAATKIRNCRWLLTPMQFHTQGQWLFRHVAQRRSCGRGGRSTYWSNRATHRPHSRQCFERNGLRASQTMQ